MIASPYRWLERVIRLQEKRPYSFTTIACFSVFVGSVRVLEEWALGHRAIDDLLANLLQNVSFYLMCFFSYTAAMRVVVPQSWRRTINVVLIGIFCGILPPLIDYAALGDGGFRYSYGWLPDWSFWIYAPDANLTVGETSVLWATVLLSGCYVWIKTRDLARTLAGLVLAYCVVVFNIAVVYTAAAYALHAATAKPALQFDMTNAQLVAALALYLALQRDLAVGLARRINHALPFGLIFAAGAAFAGAFDHRIAVYALLPLLGFAVAIAQNDLFDRDDDARQGRRSYLDADDVRFFEAVYLAFALNFIQIGSVIGAGLLVFFVASVVYNYPSYRAKAFFPSNLKIEGVWGLTACFMGVVAALEQPVAVVDPGLARIDSETVAGAFDPTTLVFLLLVFGGWSLVAALKDYKDVRADLHAGVRTPYTIAVRRGWGLRRTHAAVKAAVAVALVLPVPLLAAIGRVPVGWTAGGLAAGAAVFWLMSARPSARRFEGALAVINGYLAYLAALLAAYP